MLVSESVIPGHIWPSMDICRSHNPLLYVQEHNGQMQLPFVPNDNACDKAIIDHAIISDRECVVIDRREV